VIMVASRTRSLDLTASYRCYSFVRVPAARVPNLCEMSVRDVCLSSCRLSDYLVGSDIGWGIAVEDAQHTCYPKMKICSWVLHTVQSDVGLRRFGKDRNIDVLRR